jgi:hypothetical protein
MTTKADPNEPVKLGMLNEAVDAILEGMSKMVEGLENKMHSRFDNLEAKVNNNHNDLKDEIDGLKADLSTTASRQELEELKEKVNKLLSN